MSSRSDDDGQFRNRAEPIDFIKKYTQSEQFDAIFSEGMALVEATAAYLDGDGRREARELTQNATMAYASESMRLTTRLMQLASWLLIRRAVSEGEMTPEEAAKQQTRVQLKPIEASERSPHFDQLPTTLRDLIEKSSRLITRVIKIDQMLNDERRHDDVAGQNPLGDQIARIAAAFNDNHGRNIRKTKQR